ncbi:hypothetical protein GG344DRAFT_70558 [Lentinula edodes]|nr:hypothetical protein GG344DRAFT_70558 [Lentinula edodes]
MKATVLFLFLTLMSLMTPLTTFHEATGSPRWRIMDYNSNTTENIIIPFNTIKKLGAGIEYKSFYIIFDTRTPPIFEITHPHSMRHMSHKTIRLRNLYQNAAHAHIAPYAYTLEALLSAGHPLQLAILKPQLELYRNSKTTLWISTFLQKLQRYVWSSTSSPAEAFEHCSSNLTSIEDHSPDTFYCYHVTVTPTRIILEGPNQEFIRSHSLIQQFLGYEDNFLHVSINDEDQLPIVWNLEYNQELHKHINVLLTQGITISTKKFDFVAHLAPSTPGNSFWFMKPFHHPNFGALDGQKIQTLILKAANHFCTLNCKNSIIFEYWYNVDMNWIEINEKISEDYIIEKTLHALSQFRKLDKICKTWVKIGLRDRVGPPEKGCAREGRSLGARLEHGRPRVWEVVTEKQYVVRHRDPEAYRIARELKEVWGDDHRDDRQELRETEVQRDRDWTYAKGRKELTRNHYSKRAFNGDGVKCGTHEAKLIGDCPAAYTSRGAVASDGANSNSHIEENLNFSLWENIHIE